ncbi:ComEA family DNA-binding protein [Gaoshiqia sp. Z1-71]|uniref:ComEA family DNA-binding protein n=1 Tax=Gaoshiqia hydrogeniformans TaxID=3290090 RepID=UPI003BF7C092
MKKASFTVFMLLSAVWVYAQEADRQFRYQLEALIEMSLTENEETDAEQLLIELQQIRENPINLNQANEADLLSLHFLTPRQVQSVMEYRKKYGPIFSVYELAAIEGFQIELARLLGEFVSFDLIPTERKSFRPRQELILRAVRLMEEQAGFTDRKYEGSPEKLYTRYHFSSSRIEAGFTAEKDAGESFFKGANPNGFDFYSGFARLTFGKKNPSLTVGDYLLQFGQGLAAWQGFSMGKSAEVSRVAKFNQGFKPYRSTDENNYMRGAAASFPVGRFQLSPFFSHKKFDANTERADDMSVFTSFQTSGLHRTTSEIEDKNSVSSTVAGANLTYNATNLAWGITGFHTHFEWPLKRSNDLYNRFLFDGNRISNLSLDYRWSTNRLYLFGELASDFSGGLAGLNGLMFQPVDQLELSALYRNISKNYNSPFSSSFTENSRVNDEQGFYLGTKIQPAPKVRLNLYADFFSYKWIKYTTAAPGKGKEFMMQGSYQLSRNWQLLGRYFYEKKPVKVNGLLMKENLDQTRQSIRLQVSGKLGATFPVKSRLEQSFYHHDHWSSGIFISQDIGFQPEKWPIQFWYRIAYFHTDDYDSRVYSYENDLLYQFSVPAFYDEGIRSYLTGKVKICEKTEFWFKVSRSWLFGADGIGSGYNLIEGNKRTEVKFQLRFRI